MRRKNEIHHKIIHSICGRVILSWKYTKEKTIKRMSPAIEVIILI